MPDADVAAYIGRWRPSSASPQAAAFARDVIGLVAPGGQERAKNLLWAAGKLADSGLGLGLEPAPEVLLHPSVTERFTRCAPGLPGVARRTLRTNLRFTGRRVVPQLYPADLPLPRERAKKPYSPAELGGFLAQPATQRRMRAAGLVCLGAGAGLIRGDLRDVLFYGYYFSAGVMMPEENGRAVPGAARRATLSSCLHDPVRAFAPVLTAMPGQGTPPGDILHDSGCAHRDAGAWAIPLRAAGAQLVQDLHPHDRGPKGTHDGAVIANGSLYCPQTPRPLPEPGPLARTATREQAADRERKTAELARYKPGRLTSDDQDGYRVRCPAAMGKIRCPLRPASMTPDRDRPEILQPPEHPQACRAQQTITIPPDVLAKTAQKHDYPSAAWRRSYSRRTGAERGFATAKDPASTNISRGWCRLMGLAPLMLFATTPLIVRNQRILHTWNTRQEETQHRAAAGLPQTTRKRRRKTLAGLAAGPP